MDELTENIDKLIDLSRYYIYDDSYETHIKNLYELKHKIKKGKNIMKKHED